MESGRRVEPLSNCRRVLPQSIVETAKGAEVAKGAEAAKGAAKGAEAVYVFFSILWNRHTKVSKDYRIVGLPNMQPRPLSLKTMKTQVPILLLVSPQRSPSYLQTGRRRSSYRHAVFSCLLWKSKVLVVCNYRQPYSTITNIFSHYIIEWIFI